MGQGKTLVRRSPPAQAERHATRHAMMLVAAGGSALALGLLVYLTDRGGAHASLMPAIPAAGEHHLFGVLGQWLPSFVHTFAFGLFTAAMVPAVSALRVGACAAWCAVNVVFELGQHPQISRPLASALRAALGPGPVTRLLAHYFQRGTFDVGDIVATILGALAATAVLFLVRAIEEKHHVR